MVLLEMGGNVSEARQSAEECMRISEELGKPDTLFSSRILPARCDAAEGNVALATEKLEAMLAKATDEEQIADLHYWLWKIEEQNLVAVTFKSRSRSEETPGEQNDIHRDLKVTATNHGDAAVAGYTALYSKSPKFEFRKRIAELKGERIPKSADDLDEAA
jgi:hypothetical protein